jgi:16S rRNA (guanine527-N7)-methyltransferase
VSTASPTAERDRVDVAAAINETFGERVATADAYAELLRTDGIERGLIGPREADRLWSRHILNSAVLAPLISPAARVVDLGSGAGLPGVPLAIARPDLSVVLLEPMQRRASFLCDCVASLALANVVVVQGRAQDGLSPLADFVVARAIAPLEPLMRLSFGLLADNGVLLALKGAKAAGELDIMQRESTVDAQLLTLPAPDQPASVIRVVRPARPQRSRTGRARKGSR